MNNNSFKLFILVIVILFSFSFSAKSSTKSFSEAHKAVCKKIVGKKFGYHKKPITKEKCNKMVFSYVKDIDSKLLVITSMMDEILKHANNKNYKIEKLSDELNRLLEMKCLTPEFYEKKIQFLKNNDYFMACKFPAKMNKYFPPDAKVKIIFYADSKRDVKALEIKLILEAYSKNEMKDKKLLSMSNIIEELLNLGFLNYNNKNINAFAKVKPPLSIMYFQKKIKDKTNIKNIN